MPDNLAPVLKDLPRTPWNKGKLIGAKPRCGQSTSGASERGGWLRDARETSPCSISRSTANSAAVTLSL
jgi:hypothetical protein